MARTREMVGPVDDVFLPVTVTFPHLGWLGPSAVCPTDPHHGEPHAGDHPRGHVVQLSDKRYPVGDEVEGKRLTLQGRIRESECVYARQPLRVCV